MHICVYTHVEMYVHGWICIVTLWNLGTRTLISSGHKVPLTSFFLVAFFMIFTFLENAKLLLQLRRGRRGSLWQEWHRVLFNYCSVEYFSFYFEVFGGRGCAINPVDTSDLFLIFKVNILVWFSHTLFCWGKISSPHS